GYQVAVGPELLGIGRIGDRELPAPNQRALSRQLVHVGAADLGNQHVTVGEGRVAVRVVDAAGWVVRAVACRPDLRRGAAGRTEEEDAAVLRVGDGDGPVLEPVGVVRLIEVAGRGARRLGMAVLEDHLPGWNSDLDDRVLALLLGDDPVPVVGEEGVVRKVEAPLRRGTTASWVLPEDPLMRV